jgi:hypothetical protein
MNRSSIKNCKLRQAFTCDLHKTLQQKHTIKVTPVTRYTNLRHNRQTGRQQITVMFSETLTVVVTSKGPPQLSRQPANSPTSSFSQRVLWLLSSEIWRSALCYIAAKVSQENSACIFRVEEYFTLHKKASNSTEMFVIYQTVRHRTPVDYNIRSIKYSQKYSVRPISIVSLY